MAGKTHSYASVTSNPNPEAEEKKRERWENKWGTGKSDSEYQELDATYKSLSAEYKGAIAPRLELNLVDLCIWRQERKKAVEEGDIAKAKRLTEMIKATMDSEAMKVGDAKPLEAFRADGFADRLEKAGLMKDGVLALENVIPYIKTDHGKYNMSKDAFDGMLLSVVNACRFNGGMPEYATLPDNMRVDDVLGELSDTPNQEERDAMLEFGVPFGQKRDQWGAHPQTADKVGPP